MALKSKKTGPKSGTRARPGAGPGTGTKPEKSSESPSKLIDRRIRDLAGWRGETLSRMRELILKADTGITEEWKWENPVWSCQGILCTGEAYNKTVKLTFAKGAQLPDPSSLFNSSLEGNTRRAIDIREGEKIDARAFQTLIRAAVAANASPAPTPTKAKPDIGKSKRGTGDIKPSLSKAKPPAGDVKSDADKAKPVKLLSGGNPQIAKADGDAPVQDYIAALTDWKSDLAKRLDALIVKNAPKVRKAVKWNSPFYGIEGQGWFLSFHVFTKYLKVTFFQGRSLRPIPPGGTEKSKDVRWIDIYATDALDEAQMADWIKQAAAIPGWIP